MKYKNSIVIIAFAAILVWASGCHKPFGISGNSQVSTETRPMVSFDKIVNEGSFNVYITPDTIYQVVVEAETNLIPYIRTMVNGNTLIIDTRENLNNNYPINIYVKTPVLHSVELQGSGLMVFDSLKTENMLIEISGSGDINGEVVANTVNTKISGSGTIFLEASSNSFEADISGSGYLDLRGETNTAHLFINGSGNINAYNFIQKDCYAKISGSGDMYLNVLNNLDVNISGSGNIFYTGNPQLTINITGSGSVIHQ
jgi:hypothetical protein